ncbi:MAG TPA: phosphohydrolase, partial [Candidatus Goldiibacteriota bacterium]|nr:phosphohydrolase [Candidatus Goldiibacteriota bacterium]
LFAGEVGAKLHNPSADILNTKPYTQDDTAYREYMVKLRHVKGRMFTREGRRLAEERHAFMVLFFKRLGMETEGKI